MHENGVFRNTLPVEAVSKRWPVCILLWAKNKLEKLLQLFENDIVIIMLFPCVSLPQAQIQNRPRSQPGKRPGERG